MRHVLFIVLGFSLLVGQAALGVLLPLGDWAPNVLLPIVLYLGVTPDISLARGALSAFVLGYLLDAFCGSPMGLSTFVLVASYLVARGSGLSLFMRGSLFKIAMTFVFGLLAGVSILALRAIFEPPAPFPVGTALDAALGLGAGALVTALISPPLYALVRRLDGLSTRRRDESAANA